MATLLRSFVAALVFSAWLATGCGRLLPVDGVDGVTSPTDGGAGPDSSTDAGSNSAAEASAGDGAAADASPDGGVVCAIDAPLTGASGACGGLGGAILTGDVEREDNDTTPQTLERDFPVCGAVAGNDVDRFRMAVHAGDCLVFSFRTNGATALMEAPDASTITFSASADLSFQAIGDGTVSMTLRSTVGGPTTYTILLR